MERLDGDRLIDCLDGDRLIDLLDELKDWIPLVSFTHKSQDRHL